MNFPAQVGEEGDAYSTPLPKGPLKCWGQTPSSAPGYPPSGPESRAPDCDLGNNECLLSLSLHGPITSEGRHISHLKLCDDAVT